MPRRISRLIVRALTFSLAAADEPARFRNWLVLGEVVGVHIDDAIITDGRVDQSKFRPIARLGYADYTTVDSHFEMPFPD